MSAYPDSFSHVLLSLRASWILNWVGLSRTDKVGLGRPLVDLGLLDLLGLTQLDLGSSFAPHAPISCCVKEIEGMSELFIQKISCSVR